MRCTWPSPGPGRPDGASTTTRRPSAAEMLPHSAWAADVAGLSEQAGEWLRALPAERARLRGQARVLATPALHPSGIGRVAQVAGRVIGAAAGWATVDLGRAAYRSVILGERDDGRVAAAVERAEQIVRDSGPVYVKLGQFISTAQGLLPDEVVDTFAWCRDEVPPMRTSVARRVVERELGRPIDEVFESFGDHPIASASIAQAHGARLRATVQ